ncbi:CopG family transcriptional regulator [Chiayiivirga flava]|uniref:CopG family transcriptional regulator n=1 Tax=Chiayiivirga flava TaxID=659595 RepID=A0A7W8G1P3_9GAMM|nr:CopG family transcriptional regulator [Chiayiivirga flava]MBB5209619.1 hypothetical protein [Chiayiivirga flava]
MSQLTLYLDEETEAIVRDRAKAAGLSNSRWVAQLIRRNALAAWPVELSLLAGRFPDFPLREDALALPDDVPRVGF